MRCPLPVQIEHAALGTGGPGGLPLVGDGVQAVDPRDAGGGQAAEADPGEGDARKDAPARAGSRTRAPEVPVCHWNA
ncbi:hypothetical protein ACZ90_30040 [Streptomyces albus subsp. albus]|nr:hypothetical protein ACZ90_30040 [Streptomyces albus subsp. albus]